MLELDNIEKRFLKAMDIEIMNNMFFDAYRKRMYLFAGNYKKYYKNKKLAKDANAYESGNDVIALINKYTYSVGRNGLIANLERGIRISRGDLWYNLELDGTKNASLSVAHKKTQNAEPIKKSTLMTKIFGECPINPFKKQNLDYYYIFDTYKLGFSIDNLPDKNRVLLGIGSGNKYNYIDCDGEIISIGNNSKLNVEFNYENFVAVVENYMGIVSDPDARQALANAIEFMCCVVIPSMLEKEIAERKELIESYVSEGYECDKEEAQLECLEKIYREFAKYAIKDDEEYKKPIYKHPGEANN